MFIVSDLTEFNGEFIYKRDYEEHKFVDFEDAYKWYRVCCDSNYEAFGSRRDWEVKICYHDEKQNVLVELGKETNETERDL